jgi:hypothetical protein
MCENVIAVIAKGCNVGRGGAGEGAGKNKTLIRVKAYLRSSPEEP